VARAGGVLDLTRPETLPIMPTNATARLARGEATMPARPVTAKVPSSPARAEPLPVLPAEKALPVRIPPARPAVRQGISFWILAAVAGMVVGVLVVMMMLSTASHSSPMLALPPPTQPVALVLPPVATAVATKEQALTDVEQLADKGKFFDALAKWKDFNDAMPELAQAHIDLLNSKLLPGARQEWLDAVGQLSTQLNSGTTTPAALAANLVALDGQLRAWPFPNSEEMTQTENALAVKLKFLGQLPDAPVWLVDNLTVAGSGPDYQDATAVVSIPELDALLSSAGGKFQVSAAPATSITLPAKDSWFNFQVLDVDFAPNSFLILHDASRGAAGGRFLQLEKEGPGKTRLTWRQFQANADVFQRFPANAPLRPVSRELWLHFAGDPPLPSFYLLLRRTDNTAIQSWKPLSVPLAWLSLKGAPALVALPPWLGNNLPWHASAGQSFHLEPTSLSPAASLLSALDMPPAPAPGAAQYPAANLVEKLDEKISSKKTDLAQAQQDWQGLIAAASGPSIDRRPPQGAIDLAAETVKKIQQDIDQAQAAATTTAQAGWPTTAAPWLLYYTVASKDTLIFLQFNPHETGPTP
jgi:hypothetical protein